MFSVGIKYSVSGIVSIILVLYIIILPAYHCSSSSSSTVRHAFQPLCRNRAMFVGTSCVAVSNSWASLLRVTIA